MNELDRLVRKYKLYDQNTFFIDIGCFDGMYKNLVFDYVNNYNWEGIMVEPIKEYFLKLADNYREKHVVVENSAIYKQYSKNTMYKLKGEGYKKWYQTISSLNKEHLLKHGVKENDVEEELVDCVPYKHLISKYFVDHIDLLIITTEGFELNILNQIKVTKPHPKIIVLKNKYFTSEANKIIEEILIDMGYRIKKLLNYIVAEKK